MYNTRVLSTVEADYINKAIQRIAQIGGQLANEVERSDVTYELSQISVELEYTIDALMYPALDWNEKEIRTIIDFYTLRAKLYEFAVCSINTQDLPSFPGTSCATLEMLNTLKDELLIIINDGDTNLQDEIDRVEQESKDRDQVLEDMINASTSALQDDLTSGQNVGGIKVGDFFPAGTLLEDLWIKLLGAIPTISNLSYGNYANPVDADQTLTITTFTWNSIASPQNLKLSDNKGTLTNVPVTGNSYTPPSPIDYNFAPYETIVWTLSGDNVNSIAVDTSAMYWSYAGALEAASDAGIRIILDADLNNAANGAANTYKKLAFTSANITFTLNTGNTWWGWIAVPKVQSGTNYTKWFVDTLNSASIGTGEFINGPQSPDVVYNGITYSIYRYSYRSPLYEPLKLHR